MKLLLAVLLALVCQIFGAPALPESRHPQDTCPGRCLMQDKYRTWFIEKMGKFREFGAAINQNNRPSVGTVLEVNKLDKYCQEVGEIKTCINNCNEPADQEKKTKALNIIAKAEAIVCDAGIKAALPCLIQVADTPSPQCDTQCAQYKQPIEAAYSDYKTTGTRDWNRAKTAGTALCKLVNCRLTCRKNDIVTKCQQSGYDNAKKLVRLLGELGQTTHAQFRPAENFPNECKPDQLMENA